MNIKWLLLASVVVLSNGVILTGAAYNRWAPPVQQLTLTERELALPYWARRSDSENSQLSLSINWQVARDDLPEWNYGRELTVSPDTFRALRLKPINCSGEARRNRTSVQGWVALEYAGSAHRQRLQQLEKALVELQDVVEERGTHSRERYQRQLEQTRISDSRLYAVVVASDLEDLKASLQNSTEVHWFVPVELSASGQCSDQQVNIKRLLISDLHLPANQRDALLGLGQQRTAYGQQPAPPRYAIDVAIGRRYEPWVMSVTACAESGCVGRQTLN